jgi:hypothetical protein
MGTGDTVVAGEGVGGFVTADVDGEAALPTNQALVMTEQDRSHTAGRHDKRLDPDGAEDEQAGQHQGRAAEQTMSEGQWRRPSVVFRWRPGHEGIASRNTGAASRMRSR